MAHFGRRYGYDYVYGMETNKETADVDYGKDKDGKPKDGFDYFLERGSFQEDVKKSGLEDAADVEAFSRASGV